MNLKEIFQLSADTDKLGTIDAIRAGIEFKGTNIWLLIGAIVIASLGLNINSAAVIIGAMLISPLMGPIVGAGMALGMFDLVLLRRSLLNLGVMTAVSLAVSTIYFSLSPLSGAQSELLSRTTPTFYDVLIASFGGAAMIISVSRKTRSTNTLAGVAIATALMPPLCTAGFGLANRDMGFFFGAMYLYLINSVFIGLASFLFTKYLGLAAERTEDGPKVTVRNRHIAVSLLAVFVFIAPSIWMAYDMVQETTFKNNVARFVNNVLKFEKSSVVNVGSTRGGDHPRIEATVLGSTLSDDLVKHLSSLLPQYGLQGVSLKLFQNNVGTTLLPDIGTGIDINGGNSPTVSLSTSTSSTLPQRFATDPQESSSSETTKKDILERVEAEARLVFPSLLNLAWADLLARPKEQLDSSLNYTVFVRWLGPTDNAQKTRFASWIRLRLASDRINIEEF